MPTYAFTKLIYVNGEQCAYQNSQVSGLKEHLKLEGNQYSILIAMFTAG
jgi:ACS family pantothenate transporter-like MFS transporter